MKKILPVLFISAFYFGITNLNAQTYSFAFSQFTNPYTPIVGGTDIFGSSPWFQNIASIPIGFTYNYQGTNETSVDIAGGGAIAWDVAVDNMGFYIYFAELRDTGSVFSKSPITYQVSGTPGNRILKIQWVDAGFNNEYPAFQSTANFQTWLYEADNSMEVHIGPSTIINPANCFLNPASPGPSIGVIQLDQAQTTLLYSLALTGNSAAPTQSVYNTSVYPPVSLSDVPPSGTVYRFAQVISGIDEAHQVFSTVGMFPNPANENSTLIYSVKSSGDVNVVITDMQGRVISNDAQGTLTKGTYHYDLNTANLSNGIYSVTLVSGEQRITQKLSVAH